MSFTFYLSSAMMLATYLAIAWVVTDVLHLKGQADTLVRTILMGFGFAMYGSLLMWQQRRRRRSQSAVPGGDKDDEIVHLFRQAENRLTSSRLGRDAKLCTMPLFVVLGDAGSAKTATMTHSGLEPELLSGQVHQDGVIAPTRTANFWLGKQAVFVEAGGQLTADAGAWLQLLKRLRPERWGALFRKAKHTAARGVIVCVNCESFISSGATQNLEAMSRRLQGQITELGKSTGGQIPVYVLFTKLDRIHHFPDFAANLANQEVNQVLGVTLPMGSTAAAGVYAEQETARLTEAFNELYYAMSDKRPSFLAREHDGARLGGIYEFPREYRKLRSLLVRFLVDLCRPSQLQLNPYLRGFYFSGVRPVTVREAQPAVKVGVAVESAFERSSQEIFNLDLLRAETPVSSVQQIQSRRIPQWLFLGHLFNEVILGDQAAMNLSGTTQTKMLRRVALVAGIGLGGLLCSGMTVSYFGNRALEQQVERAALRISSSEAGGAAQALPSRDALERLDSLRESVELLSGYARDGAPLHLRWGLYTGNELYPSARKLYFSRFKQLLFGSTQNALVEAMRKLPVKPGPTDEYRPTYDTLKAYLITTSHPDKSTREFLSPVLLDRWLAGREIDGEVRRLAQRQFDFYSEELLLGNPFSKNNDGEAIERARFYLSQFNAVDSIYAFMLAEASRKNPPVNFNRQFPGSQAYVVNNRDVPGAFSQRGWAFMEDAINNVRRFFGGERWVLGDRAQAALDPATAAPELRVRYQKDHFGNWRTYLANSHVVPYSSVGDAAQKLGQTASNESYLLALFCVATGHTAVMPSEAKAGYQPLHYVMPPGCEQKYVREANAGYMSALNGLQVSLDRLAKTATDEMLADGALREANNALRVTREIAQNFRIDPEGNVHGLTQKLLEEPIHYAEAVLGGIRPARLNGEGQRLCGQFSELNRKYPFNTSSSVDASLDEVNAIFRPSDGRLRAFYDSQLKEFLDKSGGRYVRREGARMRVTDSFLNFFNRAMAFSTALYGDNGTQPQLSYSMTALPSEGLRGVTLTLDGQVLKGTGRGGETKRFTWPGSGNQGARLSGNLGGGDLSFITYDGLWAAFRFFGDADRFEAAGSGYTLQWVPRQGQSAQPIRLDNGSSLVLPFSLDLRGAPPVFRKGYLSGFGCVADVAR